MPVDYYPNKSVAELKAILDKLQKRQTDGLLVEVAAAGIRTTRDIGAGNSRPEVEIKRVLWALYRRAKGTNEAANWPNPYDDMIRRTLPSYGGPAYS